MDYEKKISKLLDAKLVPNSGAGQHHKGDMRTKNFHIDTKYTDADQYIMKLKDLNKLEKQADQIKKFPALVVGFGHKNFAVVHAELLKDLEDYYERVQFNDSITRE